MSDRRAVSAGHLGASSVAAAHETWRVAVGGNRVENMTVDQIAQAFHNGHLNVRTPLWPPGTTGWQALGNFEQFQSHPNAYASPGLSQFEEADDDPTRMWTGGSDMDLQSMEAMMAVEQEPAEQHRPTSRTGTRQVPPSRAPVGSRPMPMPPPPVPSRPAPTASLPPSRVAPASVPPFRKGRGNGLMLVAGLVGLVGLGSAILAARGNWGNAQQAPAAEPPSAAASEAPAPVAAEPTPAALAEPKAAAPEAKPENSGSELGEARLAKYEDTPAAAFVAGETPKAAAEPEKSERPKSQKVEPPAANEAKADAPRAPSRAERALAKANKLKAEEGVSSSSSKRKSRLTETEQGSRSTPKRTAAALPAPAPKPKATPAPRVEKAEKPEKAEKAEAPTETQPPANAAVNEAAAAALANSSNLAASCRPPGGPSGQGKARVIYSNDGEVQSVEILTAKFRDTLTGSCVRMVFRRAKIAPFKGEPPTFIKSFTIPES